MSDRKGPLGALPALSHVARGALVAVGGLALAGAALLIAQAFLLASVLAAIVDGRTDALVEPVLALVGVAAGRALCGWATRVVSERAAAGVREELRAAAVDRALEQGPEWISARGTGATASLLTRGLDALDAYFTEYLPALVTAMVVPFAVGAAILWADWPSAVIIACTLPLLPVFAVLVGMHTRDQVERSTDATQRLAGHLLEMVRALPVLTAFGRAARQAEAVRRVSDRHRRSTLDTLKVAFSSAFVLELAATLSVALVAVVIGVRLVNGDMALAIGLGVLILAPECFQPIRAVGAAFHASQDGTEAIRRVTEILDAPPGAASTKRPAGAGVSAHAVSTQCRQVRVEGLRVARRDGYAPDGETFVVRHGELCWLSSRSGAGKSTTLRVLLGFVRASHGTVDVDGQPLDEMDMSTWRREVAWVPQHPTLTEASVRAELTALGGQREPEQAEIESVACGLGIESLLDADPVRLSVGQRQRVAVARALLKLRCGAWLLLLDEPTAHLDDANARRVLDAVHAAAAAGAAVIIAAHSVGERGSDAVQDSDNVRDEPSDSPNVRPPYRATPLGHLSTDGPPDAGAPLPLRAIVSWRLLGGVGLGALALACGIALAATSGWLIARASQQPPILMLMVAVVGVRTFGLGRAVFRYAERLVTHDAVLRLSTHLREHLWRALVRLGPARALVAAESQQRLVRDVDTVRDLVPRVVTPPLVVAVVAAVAIAVQTMVLPVAGVVLAVAVLVGGALAVLVAFHVERRAATALATGRRQVGGHVLALLDSAGELLAYGRARTRRAELAAADARLVRHARRSALGGGIAGGLITFASGTAAAVCALAAAGAVAAGTLNPVLAPLLALVPLALAEVLVLLPPVAGQADTLRSALRRLGTPHVEIPDHGRTSRVPAADGGVHLRDVTVRWPGADALALSRVGIDVPAGTEVAVRAPSGAGKSTLLATLLGFVDPERGEVRVPERVIWAPQEPQLVSTTLAENLRVADPHASTGALADALRTACLDEYADRLDLVLGSAGTGLSGGQAGRLSLARALLAARRAGQGALVLLDEPTAHLDAATANTVLTNLRAAFAGHTIVHVTHRADDAAGADQVIELRSGRTRDLVPVPS